MKKSTNFLTLIALGLLFVFSFTSCENAEEVATEPDAEPVAESTFDLETGKAGVMASNQMFMEFVAAGDSIGLGNLYTEDAKFMVTGMPSITGISNIQSAFSGFIKSGITGADLRTVEVWGTEEFITEEGEYSLYAGDDEVDQGKYLVLWKNVDGKYKFYRDIFNSDLSPK